MASKTKDETPEVEETVEETPEQVDVGSGENNPFVQADMALIESAQRQHPEPGPASTHAAFVPNGDSQTDTAKYLVAEARDNGIDQSAIRVVQGGFAITEELADVL